MTSIPEEQPVTEPVPIQVPPPVSYRSHVADHEFRLPVPESVPAPLVTQARHRAGGRHQLERPSLVQRLLGRA